MTHNETHLTDVRMRNAYVLMRFSEFIQRMSAPIRNPKCLNIRYSILTIINPKLSSSRHMIIGSGPLTHLSARANVTSDGL